MAIKYNESEVLQYQMQFETAATLILMSDYTVSCGESNFDAILKMLSTIENFSELTIAVSALEEKEAAYFGNLVENMNKLENTITKGFSNE